MPRFGARSFARGWNSLKTEFAGIGNVRGRGLMQAVEFTTADNAPDAATALAVQQAAVDAELLLLTCGPYGNVIRIIPALNVTSDEIQSGLTRFAQALKTATISTSPGFAGDHCSVDHRKRHMSHSFDPTTLHTDLFIDGVWRKATGAATFTVENPATHEVIAEVADGGPEDAIAAIEAAGHAQATWSKSTPRERADILRAAFDLVIANTDRLAAIMTAEMGKPLAEAKGEVAYGAEFLRWFSEEAVRIGGDHATSVDGNTRILITKEPVGPCVLVTPWNFPLAMAARKIAPAVAAGCTMVFKPADLTPLTALALVDIFQQAGLPDGVLNVVTTSSAASVVEPWMSSGVARKISFTGSTGVGKILLRQAAENVMRSSMELGGNAPFIVLSDADVERAVDGAMQAKMRNMGEACTAANRFFVHRSLAEEFAEKLGKRMSELQVGNGALEGTEVGPLIEQAGLDKVEALVADAVAKGARILTGGSRPQGPGILLHTHRPYGRSPRCRTDANRDLRPGRGDHTLRQRGRRSPPRK